VGFSVHEGEVLSIIGVNGSGKSSLLKIISGIYKPTTGKIVKKYKNLAYVPQKIDIDTTFPMQVEEFIKVYNPGVTSKEILKYFKKFQSESLITKNISNLSGGELQKVLIISALISGPDIILLDEPTAGIDVLGEETFYKIISDVKEAFPRIAIILVSHNIHLVYKNSDNVVCLHKNNYCCHGTPHEVKSKKEIQEIFGEYVLPYEHHPHKKHHD